MATDAAWRRNGKTSLALFFAAATLSVACHVLATTADSQLLAQLHFVFVGTTVIAFVGSLFAILSMVAVRWSTTPVSMPLVALVLLLGGVGGFLTTAYGAFLAIMTSGHSSQ